MQLNNLFPVDPGQVTLGRADGEAKLTATGDSVGALLGAANGGLKVRLGGGTMSKGLLETIGLILPNITSSPKMFGDTYDRRSSCAGADLVASNGAVRVHAVRSFKHGHRS